MHDRLPDIKPCDKDTFLVVALWLGKLFSSSFYPQSKLVALEMLDTISQYIPFQTRLNYILPLVRNSITSMDLEGVNQARIKSSSNNKVKVRVLEVVLNLFKEL